MAHLAGICYLAVKKAMFLAMKTSIKLNVFLWRLFINSQTCSWQISHKHLNGICSFMLCLLRLLHTGVLAPPWDILILHLFTSKWKQNIIRSVLLLLELSSMLFSRNEKSECCLALTHSWLLSINSFNWKLFMTEVLQRRDSSFYIVHLKHF